MCEHSYIIRVSRCVEKESGELIIDGIVEVPANGKRMVFHSIHELWDILWSTSKLQSKKGNTTPT
jgi:hypothetical protein